MSNRPNPRIVSLLPSATEILYAIGAADEVVAATHECDYPAQVERLPRITSSVYDHEGKSCADIDRHIKRAIHDGSSIYQLDDDLLAQLQPDLIVTQELCEVCAVSYHDVGRAVRALHAETRVLSLEPHSIAEILSTITEVGRQTNHVAKAEELVGRLGARLDAVRALPPITDPPRVVCVEWTDPLMAGGHWVPEMVQSAGAIDALGVAHEPSRWVSAEEIHSAKPDIIILMPCGFHLDDTVRIGKQLMRDGGPAWVGNAQVVAVDGSSYFNRPGPRIIDGVELVAHIVRGVVDETTGRAMWLTPIPALT